MNLISSLIQAITTPIRQLMTWFVQCLPGMNTIARLSLPTKWSLLSLLFLIMIWGAALVKHLFFSPDSVRDWFWYVFFPIPFVVSIPLFVYFFVHFLLKEQVSRYPELDRIWNDGLEQTKDKGLSISNTPLFLILGASNQREVKTLTGSMGLEFPVDIQASGSPPLTFHACNDAIFVFLNGCNCISRLTTTANSSSNEKSSSAVSGMQPSDVGGTIDASHLSAPLLNVGPENFSKTMNSEPFVAGGTMLLDENQDMNELWKPASKSKILTSQDIVDIDDRLRHVCKLIKKARLPLCPINGLVTTMKFELVESSGAQLQVAIQKDLAVLREEFQVRCPNTVLITGMEEEEGFIEMIKRLPPQQPTENRFGKGSDIWVAPEAARLDAIAVHATATFEDWIYMLFQEANALKKKNNARLFMMLCRVRGAFSVSLRSVLSNGFGFDPRIEPQLAFEQFLFGGCYFAATGTHPSEQAFLKSVFAKVMQQEGELEWSPQARRQNAQYQFLANIAALIGTLALIAIASMLIHAFLISRTK